MQIDRTVFIGTRRIRKGTQSVGINAGNSIGIRDQDGQKGLGKKVPDLVKTPRSHNLRLDLYWNFLERRSIQDETGGRFRSSTSFFWRLSTRLGAPKQGLDRIYNFLRGNVSGVKMMRESKLLLIDRWTADFQNAAIVKALSDQSTDQTSFSKLTFSKLLGNGSTIELPVLFQMLYFEKRPDFEAIEARMQGREVKSCVLIFTLLAFDPPHEPFPCVILSSD